MQNNDQKQRAIFAGIFGKPPDLPMLKPSKRIHSDDISVTIFGQVYDYDQFNHIILHNIDTKTSRLISEHNYKFKHMKSPYDAKTEHLKIKIPSDMPKDHLGKYVKIEGIIKKYKSECWYIKGLYIQDIYNLSATT
jgi:hypothetical protein